MAKTRYMTVAEVADYLRVSVWTVRRLVRRGQLGDVVKEAGPKGQALENGQIWIPIDGLHAYIQRHTVTAKETR